MPYDHNLCRACIKGEEGPSIDWAIIGAMTGPGAVKVEPAWVIRLEAQYQKAGVPVFEKDNLQSLCGPGATLLRAWPTLEA